MLPVGLFCMLTLFLVHGSSLIKLSRFLYGLGAPYKSILRALPRKAGKEPIFLCKINKLLRQGGSELIRQLGHGKGFVQKINAFIQATIV